MRHFDNVNKFKESCNSSIGILIDKLVNDIKCEVMDIINYNLTLENENQKLKRQLEGKNGNNKES